MSEIRDKVQLRRALPDPATCRALRVAGRLSLAEMAAAVGVDRVSIARYEGGVRQPRGEQLQRYATALAEIARTLEELAADAGGEPCE